MESFRNPFAIRIGPAMRGGKTFTVLATRSEMGRLVSELTDALQQCDDGTLPALGHRVEDSKTMFSANDVPLWSSYATLFREQTADISFGFDLVPSLDEAHADAAKQSNRPALVGKFLIILLAVIGLMTVFGWLADAAIDVLRLMGLSA